MAVCQERELVVNAGDLPGRDAARHPAGVRAAIVAQASHGKTKAGKSGTVERSRVTTGGAKDGREWNHGMKPVPTDRKSVV